MKDYFEFAKTIAKAAGDITLEYYGSKIDVESKADDSPVTIADKRAEEYLRSEIEKRFPDDGIVGEEFGVKEGKSGVRWLLDPIDGTKTFIRGIPLYGTLIAVEKDGETEVGVVRYPPLHQTLAALTGGGCFLNDERCRVSDTADIAQATALTTSTGHFIDFLGEAAFLAFSRQPKIVRTWGDCYGYMLVATGRADLMIDPIVNAWDVAPMIPIINEAGGRITDTQRNPKLIGHNAIACNVDLHDAALKMIGR